MCNFLEAAELWQGGHPPSTASVPVHPVVGPQPPVRSVTRIQLETDARGSHPNFGGGHQAQPEGLGQWLCNFPIWYLKKLPLPGCPSFVTMT